MEVACETVRRVWASRYLTLLIFKNIYQQVKQARGRKKGKFHQKRGKYMKYASFMVKSKKNRWEGTRFYTPRNKINFIKNIRFAISNRHAKKDITNLRFVLMIFLITKYP